MYNGNATQLNLFQTSTGVSFPLLQRAVNGTLYGAFRDDTMLIDQTGTHRLLIDVRNDRSWQTKITAEIDRLLTKPVGRILQENVSIDDARVGETATLTLQIINEGKADLTLRDYSSTVDGVTIDLPGQAIAPQDTAEIALHYGPTSAGEHSGLISINTPGALLEAVTVPLTSDVLAAPRPRLFTSIKQIDLVEAETLRPGIFAVNIRNDGNAPLRVIVDKASDGVTGTGAVAINSGKTGQVTYTIDPGADGPFAGSLVLTTNDPDASRITIPVNATGISIPPEPACRFRWQRPRGLPGFPLFCRSLLCSEFNGRPRRQRRQHRLYQFPDLLSILRQNHRKLISTQKKPSCAVTKATYHPTIFTSRIYSNARLRSSSISSALTQMSQS